MGVCHCHYAQEVEQDSPHCEYACGEQGHTPNTQHYANGRGHNNWIEWSYRIFAYRHETCMKPPSRAKWNSRNITTFSTHTGLYRSIDDWILEQNPLEKYSIALYGRRYTGHPWLHEHIRWHHLIWNIRWDHDECLGRVIDRPKEKGITFNPEKCEFNKESSRYYVLIFSKFGVSPDPDKVNAIKVAPYSSLKSGKHMFQTQNLAH